MKIFFPGLNSLRAIAAFSVIIAHIEGYKDKLSLPNFHKSLGILGPLGVYLFFVLSGFLISYLLILEYNKNDIVNVKKFYVRRVLRIWPLYFFIVFLGFFVLPEFLEPNYFHVKTTPDFFKKISLTVLFLPNLLLYVYGSIFAIGVLWSVGAEEQFYLIWPWVVNYYKAKLYTPLLSILSMIITFKLLCGLMEYAHPAYSRYITIAKSMLPFDYMCIGGIFAYSYYKRDSLYKFICKNHVFYFCIFTVLFFICLRDFFETYQTVVNIIFGVSFAVIIVNISTNNKAKFIANSKFLDFSGRISYGIYMYHSIAIAISLIICGKSILNSGLVIYNICVYAIASLLTLIFSAISFYVYENKFLELKDKFALVKNTNKSNGGNAAIMAAPERTLDVH